MLIPPDAPPTHPDPYEQAVDAAAERRGRIPCALDAIALQRAVEEKQATALHSLHQAIDDAITRLLALWSA